VKKGLVVSFALLLASGCATTSSTNSQWIQPVQAVQLAAAAAPDGVPGVFALQVQATGTQDGFTYLNSELDYRDQRCLTVAITPDAAQQLEAKLGGPAIIALKGKLILVKGTAARTRVDFITDGKPTGKYYYQTHVRVTDPGQIQIRQ
jgi:hypothetical protein